MDSQNHHVPTTSFPAANEHVIVRPKDRGQALENPGMGWVLHYYDNSLDAYGTRLAPSDDLEDFPGITVIYLRLAWAFLEPEEGRYNWELIDTPAQRWISRGKQVAFRISCCEWMPYGTPEWVRKAGAHGYNFVPGKGVDEDGPYWEPDYNDPIFLEKLGNFLTVFSARYDGRPEVAFIDVGSFGVWGESHNFWSSKLDYDATTMNRHLDLYAAHFKQSLLVLSTAGVDHGRGEAVLEHARRLGMTLRDDSILVLEEEITPQRWARASSFWKHVPVVLESQHYGMSVNDGFWKDGSGYLQAVEDYHASYVSIHWWPREFLEGNRELVAQINRRMGYRLQLLEASWPTQVDRGAEAHFTAHWRNAGAAPCLPGGYSSVTLKDTHGGIVAVWVDEHVDMRDLPVSSGDAIQDEIPAIVQHFRFTLPERIEPGVYELFIAVGSRMGTPQIVLPLDSNDGQRRYRLGLITVQE